MGHPHRGGKYMFEYIDPKCHRKFKDQNGLNIPFPLA